MKQIDEGDEMSDRDMIDLPSGRVYANRGLVGINDDLEICQGYDGDLYIPTPKWHDHGDQFKIEDGRALADLMIARWTRYRDALK